MKHIRPDLVCIVFFFGFRYKVIGSDVYHKRDDFGSHIVNFPWLNGDVPRLSPYDFYISQSVRFALC